MFTSLRLVDFKNFRDETLHMGPLTVIVGANASGKSNLRDAFRFLHGIGRGYTLGEIIGGKYGAGQREWAPIRGAADEIIRFGRSAFMLQVEAPGIHYSITVARSERHGGMFRVTKEVLGTYRGVLRWPSTATYTSHPGYGNPVHDQDDDTHLLLRMEKTGTQRKYGDRTRVLAGVDLPTDWSWADVRAKVQVKERYFDVLVGQRGLGDHPGGGRKPLAEEASRRLDAIRQKCPEDFDALARRIEAAVQAA